jgi:three-Cys-motif partner protein
VHSIIASAHEDLVGPWAIRKHQLLRDYLIEYTKIMRGQPWCCGYEYVDAFAGTGRPRLRDDSASYIDGSPRVALGIPHPFSRYTFIETSRWRIECLRQLGDEFSDRTIDVIEGDANQMLATRIVDRFRWEYKRRGIIFLDPFGANLAYRTIERIAATGSSEIFLHLPTMALNRAALRNGPNALTGEGAAIMDRIWGSRDWRRTLFHDFRGLSGTVEVKKRPTNAEYLGRLFVEQRLKSLFPYVTDPMVMKNSAGGDLYCLIFAGHNKIGAKIADYIFRKADGRTSVPQAATLPLELLC